jgi:hypothetical protein
MSSGDCPVGPALGRAETGVEVQAARSRAASASSVAGGAVRPPSVTRIVCSNCAVPAVRHRRSGESISAFVGAAAGAAGLDASAFGAPRTDRTQGLPAK